MLNFRKRFHNPRKRIKHPELRGVFILVILTITIPLLVIILSLPTQIRQNAAGTTQCETNGDVCTPNGYGCFNGQQPLSFSCNMGYVCCRPGVSYPNGQGGNQCGNCQGTCANAGQYCEQPTTQNNQFSIYICNQTNGTWQLQYNQTGSQTCTWSAPGTGSSNPILTGNDTCTPSGGICISSGTTCSALTNVNNPGSYIPATDPSFHCLTGNGQSCCMPGGNNQSPWQCKNGACTNTQTGKVDNTQCNPLCTPPTPTPTPPKIYSCTNDCGSPDSVCKSVNGNAQGCFDQSTCSASCVKVVQHKTCTNPTSNGPGHCYPANAQCPNGSTGTDDGPECGSSGFPVVAGQCCADVGDGSSIPSKKPLGGPVVFVPAINIKTGIDGIDQYGPYVDGWITDIEEIGEDLPLLPPPLVYKTPSASLTNVLGIKLYKGTGTLSFDRTLNLFTNPFYPLGKLPEGFYNFYLHVDGYLTVQLQTTDSTNDFYVQPQKISVAKPIRLTPGDIYPPPHGDNNIDIGDYNMMLNCYGKQPTGDCKTADLNRDGKIDQEDLNLLISHFGIAGDSYTTPTYNCTIDPSCKNGEDSMQLCTMKCTRAIDFPF